ncbi:MAG: RsmD family RNA methyltransferase, partial [Gammaproteobacteria bacterium]
SRGAGQMVFIEQDPDLVNQLEQNLRKLDAEHDTILQGDALKLLKTVGSPVDIVFLDPPFTGTDYGNLCTLLEQSDCLADDALIYIEMPRKSDWPGLPPHWKIRKEKIAGQVRYALLARH